MKCVNCVAECAGRMLPPNAARRRRADLHCRKQLDSSAVHSCFDCCAFNDLIYCKVRVSISLSTSFSGNVHTNGTLRGPARAVASGHRSAAARVSWHWMLFAHLTIFTLKY